MRATRNSQSAIRSVQVVILLVLPLLVACATNPVTGKTELSLIPEDQEIAIGQESAKQIVDQMGLVEDDELQKYVSDLGMKMAIASERPRLPWKFYVLDDPVVNAFALPGGSIFITRGILTHMNSEAELISVLGHEIGHVTAKHSVSQMSKASLAQLGIGIGTAFLPESMRGIGDLASAGMGFLFLKFGRDDERQSDALGFRYMVARGYDPREMASMFHTLDRQGQQQGAGEIPEWASTHPAPENRVSATMARVSKLGLDPSTLKVERERLLEHLDGMVFGDNPRHGYSKGTAFYHPDLAFQLAFPNGWRTVNQPDAVIGISPEKDAIIQLRIVGQKPPAEYADEFFKQDGIEAGRSSNEAINGLSAYRGYFRATTSDGVQAGLASWISHGGNTYRIASFTTEARIGTWDDAFAHVVESFRNVTDQAVLAVEPARVSLVTIDGTMTIDDFQKRFPSTIPLDQLALINGVEKGDMLDAGRKVKRVIGGEVP
jgi:predicted Zn-dependent protease